MSDDPQKLTEESAVESVESDGFDADDELVDQVSDSVMDAAESGPTDEAPSHAEGELEETVEEVEEEKVKDEVDIQIDLLQDSDWVVRREAVINLGEMGDERCIEPLVRCLRDGDWQVREAAVDALGMIGSPAVELLIRWVRDWDARKYVIRAMGKMNDERVLDPLMSMLKNDQFKDDATWALVELGKPAVQKLVEGLKDKEDFVVKQSILALGEIKDPDAVEPLIEMLQSEDWFIRLTAAAALEKIHDERGREAIKGLLKDPDPVVKMRIERMIMGWKKQAANA